MVEIWKSRKLDLEKIKRHYVDILWNEEEERWRILDVKKTTRNQVEVKDKGTSLGIIIGK